MSSVSYFILVDLPKPAADIVMLSLPASVVVSGLVGID
jgi:hypothetical protein